MGWGVLIPLIVGSEEKLAAPARSLSQASYAGKEEDVVVEGGVGGLTEVSSATPRPR